MRRKVLLMLALCLAGCGADTVGTAAVGAAMKAEEVRQAQQTKEQVQKQLDAALQAEQQRLKDAEAATR